MPMTKQEIFDRVATHLLTQGEPAVENNECRYSYYGLKCAVGCLITEEAYTPNIEGKGVRFIGVVNALIKSGVLPEDDADRSAPMEYLLTQSEDDCISLLTHLQNVHDYSNPCIWRDKLMSIAHDFDLNNDVLYR